MCGFICAYNDKSFNLKKALLSIKHRGPDSSKEKLSNNWQIGFNRLSIVAPESDFDQPYTEDPNEDCLVFNGEIYNFKELQNDFVQTIEVRCMCYRLSYNSLHKT